MDQNFTTGTIAKTRDQLLKILNHALEEEAKLAATLRAVLGNVTGPHGHSLYRLFGDHCRQVEEWLREIAARAQAFGPVARGRRLAKVAETGEAAFEDPSSALPAHSMVEKLLALHEGVAARLRNDLAACGCDAATEGLLTRIVEFHETTAWMLGMVLDGPEVPGSRR